MKTDFDKPRNRRLGRTYCSPEMTVKLTPEQIADQQDGSTRIAPGLWRDRNGHLHVSIIELLAMVELDDTPANRAQVTSMIMKVWKRNCPDAMIVLQEPDR